MKHTALPLRVEHHHMQDGKGGTITSIVYTHDIIRNQFIIHWDEELAENIVRACNCHEELVEACKWAYALFDGYDSPLDTEPRKRYEQGWKQLQEALANATK